MQTIEQILNQFIDIATAHRQINSFGFGEIQDYATSGTTLYPAMWCDIGECRVSGDDDGKSLFTSQEFTFWIIDRLQKGKLNLKEIFSDTQQITLDVIAQLDKHGYHFKVDINNQLSPVFDKFHDDELAGFSFGVIVKQNFDRDRCAIPFLYPPIQNDESNPGGGQQSTFTLNWGNIGGDILNQLDLINYIATQVGGSTSVSFNAQENIAAYQVVTSDGKAGNSNLIQQKNKIIGIASAGVNIGFVGSATGFGSIQNSAWSWNIGDKIFLNGTSLSTTAPSTGFSVLLGTATKADTIDVIIQPSILL